MALTRPRPGTRHAVFTRLLALVVGAAMLALPAATATADPLPPPSTPGPVLMLPVVDDNGAAAYPWSLAYLPSGNIAMTDPTLGRIGILDTDTLTWSFFSGSISVKKPDRLVVDSANTIWYLDDAGWLGKITTNGTDFSGAQGYTFKSFSTTSQPPAIAIAPNGYIWYTMPDKSQIVSLDPNGGGTDTYSIKNAKYALGNIVVLPSGDVLVDNSTNWTILTPGTGSTRTVNWDGSDDALLDTSGTVWATTINGGLTSYDPVTGDMQVYSGPPNINGVASLAPGPDNTIWLNYANQASGTNTAVQFDLATLRYRSGTYLSLPQTFYAGSSPNTPMVASPAGKLWIAGSQYAKVAMLGTPGPPTLPCTSSGTTPVGIPIVCDALFPVTPTSLSVSWTINGTQVSTDPKFAPTPDLVGESVVGTMTATIPGVLVPQQRTTQPTLISEPTVIGFSPSSASADGGVPVTFTGTSFYPGLSVQFGTQLATVVGTNTSTSMTVTVPEEISTDGSDERTTTVPLLLAYPDGTTSDTKLVFTYTPRLKPEFVSITPNTGKGATVDSIPPPTPFTITGRNIVNGTKVLFSDGAGFSAPATNVVVKTSATTSDATITGLTPAMGVGLADITLQNPAGLESTATNAFTFTGAPVISSITPNGGPLLGGTKVEIAGGGFVSPATVTFGGAAATDVVVVDAEHITAVTPAGTGTVDVVVAGSSGSVTATGGYRYNTVAVPTITRMNPPSGPQDGGTTVTLSGTGFDTGLEVSFGVPGSPTHPKIQATSVTVTSPTQATIVTPPNPGVGDAVVCTYIVGSTVLPNCLTNVSFTFEAGTGPQVTSVEPSRVPQGQTPTLTINGSGFATDLTRGPTVTIGGQAAPLQRFVSSSQLTVTMPAGVSVGDADITVTNPTSGLAGTLKNGVEVEGPPTITSVTPASGPTAGGQLVVVTGTGFGPDTLVHVQSGDRRADATNVAATDAQHLTATLPAFVPGPADVIVDNGAFGSATLTDGFVYLVSPDPQDPPEVDSVSPNTGATAGGTDVVVLGSNFDEDECLVFFGATQAKAQAVVSSTRMTATTPAGVAGAVDVSVVCPTTGAGNLDNGFTYEGAPSLTGLAPSSGSAAGGTAVTITGAGFSANATVMFGGVEADSVTVSDASTIVAVTAAETVGTVDVVVSNPGFGSATLPGAFTFTPAPTPSPSPTDSPTPTPSPSPTDSPSPSPTDSPSPTPSPTDSPTPTPSPTDSPTPTPSPSPTDSPTPSPTDSPTPSPTDSPTPSPTDSPGPAPAPAPAPPPPPPPISTPAIAAVSPNEGPLTGGQTITITGSDFRSGATVLIEGVPATSVSVIASTTITAVTPPGPTGADDVTVRNPDGGSTTYDNGYTYEDDPVITGIDTTSGPVMGGTTVTINGSGFAADAVVNFGSVEAPSWQVVNGSQIIATTPVGRLGSTDVSVVNPHVATADLPDAFEYDLADQDPITPLALPKRLSTTGWNTLLRVPVMTNAGLQAQVRVRCSPASSCTVRRKGPALQLKLGSVRPRQVTVTVRAPEEPTNGYAPLAYRKTYGREQIGGVSR